ncbi:amidase [Saccharothrix saharensis]|uniref:Amidase n=1 Tax=Saccharothrix saharensis TaxID=571190 RepID=A0A543J6H0_9PSEU|nr:amidase [Saccharothrix saharensis]TQM78407.1 amidase [Saccharothrix saharensis]
MTQPHELTALEQARAVRDGQLTPFELVEHHLDRIDRLDGEVGAYLAVTADRARAEAAAALVALRDGEDVSPLHGVPIAVKDNVAVAGVRFTSGSAAHADRVAEHDDDVVVRLRRSGMALLGKTNLGEFALPCYTENAIAPPTRNPWDPRRTPGGSSGGSAAAVAAGLAPLAHGTDLGGSIRIPASACGLVGVKPSRGLVDDGTGPDPFGLSVDGPLARTVGDAAALLDVLAGAAPGGPRAGSLLDHARRDPGRLRIAAMATPMVPDVEPHPDCVAAHRTTGELLEQLGHHVDEVVVPADYALVEAFGAVLAVVAALPPVADEDATMPFTRYLRELSGGVTGVRLARAVGAFRLAGRRLARELYGHYDVVLSPTLAEPPGILGSLRDDADPAAEFGRMAAFMPYTALANICGLPSVNVPGCWNDEGLPIGVMLTGRHGEDATLIALAARLESARPWSGRTAAPR